MVPSRRHRIVNCHQSWSLKRKECLHPLWIFAVCFFFQCCCTQKPRDKAYDDRPLENHRSERVSDPDVKENLQRIKHSIRTNPTPEAWFPCANCDSICDHTTYICRVSAKRAQTFCRVLVVCLQDMLRSGTKPFTAVTEHSFPMATYDAKRDDFRNTSY